MEAMTMTEMENTEGGCASYIIGAFGSVVAAPATAGISLISAAAGGYAYGACMAQRSNRAAD
jgi:hypothetical protein